MALLKRCVVWLNVLFRAAVPFTSLSVSVVVSIMATALTSAMDAVSTAFNVVPLDHAASHVRRITPEVPALLKPVSKEPEKWIQSATAAKFAFLDTLGYICTAEEQTVTLWRASGSGDPVKHTLRYPITCLGTLTCPPADHIILFCTTHGLELLVARPSLRGGIQFIAVPIFMGTLTTEMTCLKGTTAGRSLLGGKDGNLYELRLTLAKTLMEDGFNATVVNLTWEWKKLLFRPAPIHQIYIDSERQLAYAINQFCEMEVLSFEQGLLSDKPSRVAVQSNQETQIVSYVVLPENGFGEAVLLGVSAHGKLYYYALDRTKLDSTELTAEKITKRAKTWCGIGLSKNLRLVHENDAPCEFLAESIREGATLEVVTVLQTTIYFSLYSHGDGMSTLWEMKNGSENFQDIQPLLGISLKGKVLGMSPRQPLSLKLPGAQRAGKKLELHELTMQYFYRAPEMTVYTSEQHQTVARQWPCEALAEILENQNLDHLTDFTQNYSPCETSAMMVFLSLEGNKAAKEMLMKQETLLASLDVGIMKYIKRLIEPIWLSEIFQCSNQGAFMAPNHVMVVKLPSEVLKLYREVARKLSSYIREFLAENRVDVYESSVNVNSASGITTQQAIALVEFKSFPERFAQSMAFLEFLSHQEPLSISMSTEKTLFREVSLMSVRDFVYLALDKPLTLRLFFETAKQQMNPAVADKLCRFFRDNAPSLDPAPRQRKEDSFVEKLPEDLKALRIKIRSLNEQLGRFGEGTRDASIRAARLREHYMPVLDFLADLVEKVTEAADKGPLITKALKYVKVVLEVAHVKTQQEILIEFALSPLGDRRILSVEPAFEAPLRAAAGVERQYHSDVSLTKRQQKATEILIGYYEATTRYEDAAWLGVMLAMQRPNSKFEGLELMTRVTRFEEAQRNFQLAGSTVDLSCHIRQLHVQKAALDIVNERYADYDKDIEDVQLLKLLDISIIPPDDLKMMIQCWLEENDGETRAAFQKSQEFKDLEDLIKAIG